MFSTVLQKTDFTLQLFVVSQMSIGRHVSIFSLFASWYEAVQTFVQLIA
jgi:hypothetical protein